MTGTTPPPASASASRTPTAGAHVPAAPTAVAVGSGIGSATLTFVPPADGGSPISEFTVTAVPLLRGVAAPRTATGPGSPITVTGLVDGIAYALSVHATNAVGSGPESAAVETVAGALTGASLLILQNPVAVGHPLRLVGYVADDGRPLGHQQLTILERLPHSTVRVASATTDAQGGYSASLFLVHNAALQAMTVIGPRVLVSPPRVAKVSFVLLKVSAVLRGGRLVVTGFVTPGSPSPLGEARVRVAIYRAAANGTRGAFIGNAVLQRTARGAPTTAFRYDHAASVLHGSAYVYVNPIGTRANAGTQATVRVRRAR